ncbi:hypothetical protein [Marinicella gelatinilytica]|uniref:hypothetical protein n=1 Tax=Marinicella gelatinilytica TaxID=2996017 RepID=UPI002260EE2A|nr:hypothetical protein [Marinicella gelatinilytica]MCX7543896.1 hypothetical protein [Marinicella gelatinilytica]
MTTQSPKIPLTIKPLSEKFAFIPVMMALKDYAVFDSWLAARDFVFDLQVTAPQVVWLDVEQLESFQNTLADINIITEQVSKETAEHIAMANKPIRGDVKIQIRTRGEMNVELVIELKAQQLISHYQVGDNADGIYHWKDDRWYQDFYLYAFKKEDLPQIEALIKGYYYRVVRDEG